MVQRGVAEEDGAHRVGEAAHQQLLELEAAAQSERDVGGEGEVGREAQQLRLVVRDERVAVLVGVLGAERRRDGRADAAREREAPVGEDMAEDLEELRAELGGRVGLVGLQRVDRGEHVRVAAREALPDDLEGARHDVGALDGDRDGHRHVGVADEVGLAARDACAAEDVHAVGDDAPAALGAALLHDRREDHRRLVVVDDGVRELGAREHDVRLAPRARERLLDAAELGDGHAELLAHARVGTDARADGACRAHRTRREGDAAALGEALDEHVPAEAAALLPAEHRRHRHPHVLARDGAVHERRVERHVARAHVQPLVATFEEGDGEALGALAAEEAVRVLQVDAHAHHARDRRERDVPLLEGAAHAEDAVALLDDAVRTDERRRVRARVRAGEAEARDERAVGQPRQEVAALLVRAVAHQQLARPERVGHGHGRVRVEAVRAELREDRGDGHRREALACARSGRRGASEGGDGVRALRGGREHPLYCNTN